MLSLVAICIGNNEDWITRPDVFWDGSCCETNDDTEGKVGTEGVSVGGIDFANGTNGELSLST